jgi:phage terminase Nu1 subunit (DNA packaging protein)
MMASVTAVAEALDLTDRRVNQLAKDGTIPRAARGQYDLDACMRAYIRFLGRAMKSKSTMDGDGNVNSSRDARNNLLTLQAERERFELAKAKSEVISISDHRGILDAMIIETKARVGAIAPRVAPHLVGETSRVMIQAKIEAETKIALSQLAEITPSLTPRTLAGGSGAAQPAAGA